MTYTNTSGPTRVIIRVGFRIDRIQHVVICDKESADTTELNIGFKIVTVLIENLYSVISSICNEKTTLGIHL